MEDQHGRQQLDESLLGSIDDDARSCWLANLDGLRLGYRL